MAPRKVAQVDVPRKYLDYIDSALQNVTRVGTMAWKMVGFPLDQVTVRSKTGSAEVYGKQTTGWVASYTKDYVVVMMISQAGTGSGSTGDGIRAIWEALYGVEGETVRPARAATPGTVPAERLPQFLDDGSIMPPKVRGSDPMTDHLHPPGPSGAATAHAARARPRLAADVRLARPDHDGDAARLVGDLHARRPHRRRPQHLSPQAARQHRDRPRADGRR